MLDDQALVLDVKDKGLVVMTGCGHAGIVNICRYAHRLCRGRPIYAVLGGFHLNGPRFEPLIPQVCADLGAMHRKWSFPPTARVGGRNMRWPRSSRTPSFPTASARASSCEVQCGGCSS